MKNLRSNRWLIFLVTNGVLVWFVIECDSDKKIEKYVINMSTMSTFIVDLDDRVIETILNFKFAIGCGKAFYLYLYIVKDYCA